MSAGPEIAIAVPAYDAAATVAGVARRCLRLATRVVVVDDGSTDATAAVAAAVGVEVLRHATNLGKGAALRTAFDRLFATGAEAVITIDADGQHVPEETPALVRAWLGGSDLVIGSRAAAFAEFGAVRRASNRISTALIARVAGADLDDVQSGFRLYARRLIAAVGFPEDRYEAESAVVVRAQRRGFRVTTVPVRLAVPDGRATSHYRPIVDSVRIAAAVARARLERTAWAARRSS